MGYVIGFFAAEIIFFAAFLVFSRLNYKKRFSNVYDHRNMFPYELNYESRFSDNMFPNVCFIIFEIFHLAVFVFSMNYFLNDKLIFNLVTTILYVVSSFLVLFVPLKLLKTHLVCSTFSIGSAFLSFASLGYTFLTFINVYPDNPAFIVFAITSFVICVFYFLLIMNPKLTSWPKVNKIEQDGKTIYQRPKYFVLALSEWLSIFGLLLSSCLGVITYILITL